MEKRILLVAIISLSLVGVSYAEKVTVENNFNTFTPDEISINVGDTVEFDITGTHNVVEVSQATWEADDTTSNGGFELDFGGGELVFDTPGIYYYVCTPHAHLGMKGIIEVSTISSITDIGRSREIFLSAYPNPVSDQLSLEFNIIEPTSLSIELFDITGRSVLSLISREYSAGVHTEILDIGDLQPGKYFIRYETANETNVKSLIKLD